MVSSVFGKPNKKFGRLTTCPNCMAVGKAKIHITEFTEVRYCGKCNLVLEPWSMVDHVNHSILKRYENVRGEYD